ARQARRQVAHQAPLYQLRQRAAGPFRRDVRAARESAGTMIGFARRRFAPGRAFMTRAASLTSIPKFPWFIHVLACLLASGASASAWGQGSDSADPSDCVPLAEQYPDLGTDQSISAR